MVEKGRGGGVSACVHARRHRLGAARELGSPKALARGAAGSPVYGVEGDTSCSANASSSSRALARALLHSSARRYCLYCLRRCAHLRADARA
eukprot:6210159-Pleurochrysis_carterae.AAC.1